MDIPSSPGTYILVLHLDIGRSIAVGRLGTFRFPAGYYLYVGSALGPGGLRARLERHLRGKGQLHWHVDFLRRWTRPVEVWYNTSTQRQECAWREILQAAGLSIPAARFGAMDCRCPGHLLYSPQRPDSALLTRVPITAFCLPA